MFLLSEVTEILPEVRSVSEVRNVDPRLTVHFWLIRLNQIRRPAVLASGKYTLHKQIDVKEDKQSKN